MNKSALFAYSQKWAAGIGKHAATLQLVRYPSSNLLSHLGNARQTELGFQTSRSLTLSVSNGLLASRAAAALFIEKARTNLKPYLGERWSTAWNQAGFTNGTLKVPATNTAEVVNMVRTLQSYFLATPSQQNAANGVTAAAAGALVTTLDNGTTALSDAKSQQRARRDSRDATHQTLSGYLRDSRKEVESAMKDMDARWKDFIEMVPGDLRAPEAVSALVAEPGLPGHVRLSFLPSLRATAYAIEVVYGETGPYLHFATVHDSVADLALMPGASVRLRVKAGNPAGQSAPSPVAAITVPAAAAA